MDIRHPIKSFRAGRKAVTASPAVLEAMSERRVSFYPLSSSTEAVDAYFQMQSGSYGFLYSNQPAVRTCVDFLARNVSQLGLKLYEKDDEDERERVYDHPAMEALDQPNLIFELVADYATYENAYLLKIRSGQKLALIRIPPYAIGVTGTDQLQAKGYKLLKQSGESIPIEPADLVHIRGYNPQDARLGISKLETLRQTLIAEGVAQAQYTDFLKSGNSHPYIKRPLEAEETRGWDKDERERFLEDWANRRQDPSKPVILGDGMDLVDPSVSPREAQALQHRELALKTVARLYGIPLAMVGLEQSELSEQHRILYSDVLPPLTETITSYLDQHLLEEEYPNEDLYFEFDPKPPSDVIEQIKNLNSAAGRPVLTVNEARKIINRNPLPGGDEPVIPANVTVGGKPSTATMPIQNPTGPSQDGEHREGDEDVVPPPLPSGNGNGKMLPIKAETHIDTKAEILQARKGQESRRNEYANEHEALLMNFFERQRRSISSRAKAANAQAFDRARWDNELSEELETLARKTLQREGGIAAARLGLPDLDFNQIENWITKGSMTKAQAINAATQNALQEAEAQGSDINDVFKDAKANRASQLATQTATVLSSFAHQEAAKQTPDAAARTKTWVGSGLPDSRHTGVSGETIGLTDTFSNGLLWPGDPAGSAEQTAGCRCLLSIT